MLLSLKGIISQDSEGNSRLQGAQPDELCDPWQKGEIGGQRGANLSHMKVKAELH